MAIQTVLHIVTVTLLVTLLVKSEPHNDRRVQTKIYVKNSHFPRQPLKIPYKKFKKYKEYDPFTFQNKWTPIGPPTDPKQTPSQRDDNQNCQMMIIWFWIFHLVQQKWFQTQQPMSKLCQQRMVLVPFQHLGH